MSQADELLETLSVDYTDEPYIYVNDDRTIVVPDELKHIAVEHDHNIETVIIDCSRYWDGHDFSKMTPYVNYMRPDGYKDSYRAKNLRVSDEDDTRILFDWTISANVTQIKGNLSFLIYIEDPDANPCWHSRLNQQMIIDEGLTCKQQIELVPDSIEEVLARTTASYIAEAKAEIEGKTALSLASIPEDYTVINNMAEEALREKAAAIKMEVEGEAITVNDSADNALLGLKVFGKTTQITTTGKNLFDVTAALANQKRATTAVSDYTAYGNGVRVTTNSYDNGRAYMYLTLNPGVYNISANVSVSGNWNFSVKNYNSDLELINDTRTTAGAISYSFTLDASALIGFCFMSVVSGGPATTATNIQLEIGSTATDYEPYSSGVASPSPQWPQTLNSVDSPEVDVCGRNLFGWNGEYISRHSEHAITAVVDNGVITLSGSSMVGYGTLEVALPLGVFKKGLTYRISRVAKNFHAGFWFYDKNNVNIGSLTTENSLAYTVPEHADHMSLFYAGVTPETEVNLTEKFMLNLGSEACPWEPYCGKQSINAVHTLPGIPVTFGGNYTDSDGQQWICDEIDFERGVYVQRVFNVELTGSEYINQSAPKWQKEGMYSAYAAPATSSSQYGFDIPDAMPWCYSTHARPNSWEWTHNDYLDNVGVRKNIIHLSLNNAATGIADTDTDAVKMSKFKAYLTAQYDAGNPVTVWYPLATPIETPLTDAELANFKMVRSNYPSTTVLNDSGAHMVIKYAGDTKNYVDNNSLTNGTLVDTATGKAYRLVVTNGQLTLVAV